MTVTVAREEDGRFLALFLDAQGGLLPAGDRLDGGVIAQDTTLDCMVDETQADVAVVLRRRAESGLASTAVKFSVSAIGYTSKGGKQS